MRLLRGAGGFLDELPRSAVPKKLPPAGIKIRVDRSVIGTAKLRAKLYRQDILTVRCGGPVHVSVRPSSMVRRQVSSLRRHCLPPHPASTVMSRLRCMDEVVVPGTLTAGSSPVIRPEMASPRRAKALVVTAGAPKGVAPGTIAEKHTTRPAMQERGCLGYAVKLRFASTLARREKINTAPVAGAGRGDSTSGTWITSAQSTAEFA